MGEEQEQVGSGPELRGTGGAEGMEGPGHGPMLGGDNGRQQGQSFKLADGREEAAGNSGGAGGNGHVAEGGSDGFRVGKARVAGMEEGKGSQVAKVGLSGATGPSADGQRQAVSSGRTARSGTKCVSEKGEVITG